MNVRSTVEVLRQIPLFAGAADAHLQLLAFAMPTITVEAGGTLMRQGEHGQAAYIVLDGTADIVRVERGGAETALGTAGRGAFLGELAMLADLPYHFTIRSPGGLTALVVSRDLFYRVAEEFPEFADSVFRMVSQRVDTSVRDLEKVEQMFRHARSFSRR